ncbi:hypothetical protein LC55x_1640 [Lysobacter capsici]|nr:hypothetical protein LC55x_1640 [Lysobacter capsici]
MQVQVLAQQIRPRRRAELRDLGLGHRRPFPRLQHRDVAAAHAHPACNLRLGTWRKRQRNGYCVLLGVAAAHGLFIGVARPGQASDQRHLTMRVNDCSQMFTSVHRALSSIKEARPTRNRAMVSSRKTQVPAIGVTFRVQPNFSHSGRRNERERKGSVRGNLPEPLGQAVGVTGACGRAEHRRRPPHHAASYRGGHPAPGCVGSRRGAGNRQIRGVLSPLRGAKRHVPGCLGSRAASTGHKPLSSEAAAVVGLDVRPTLTYDGDRHANRNRAWRGEARPSVRHDRDIAKIHHGARPAHRGGFNPHFAAPRPCRRPASRLAALANQDGRLLPGAGRRPSWQRVHGRVFRRVEAADFSLDAGARSACSSRAGLRAASNCSTEKRCTARVPGLSRVLISSDLAPRWAVLLLAVQWRSEFGSQPAGGGQPGLEDECDTLASEPMTDRVIPDSGDVMLPALLGGQVGHGELRLGRNGRLKPVFGIGLEVQANLTCTGDRHGRGIRKGSDRDHRRVAGASRSARHDAGGDAHGAPRAGRTAARLELNRLTENRECGHERRNQSAGRGRCGRLSLAEVVGEAGPSPPEVSIARISAIVRSAPPSPDRIAASSPAEEYIRIDRTEGDRLDRNHCRMEAISGDLLGIRRLVRSDACWPCAMVARRRVEGV